MEIPSAAGLNVHGESNQNSLRTEDIRTQLESYEVHAVFPGDPTFPEVSAAYNRRFTVKPAAILFPADGVQVAHVVKIAAEHKYRVVARSGGHGYTANGLGGSDGAVVVDLRKMAEIQLSPLGTADVQTGNTIGQVALALNEKGRAIPHGSCPFVGIGGHAGMDMFALSQSDADAGRLPVVQLAEDSKTLRLLLDLIYPSEQEPQLNKPAVVWNACKATRKYGMKVIENKLRRQTIDSDLMHFNSLNMYAIATDLGWEEMVMDAAQRTLGTPLKSLLFAEELKGITGADFYRFLAYRFQCEVAEVPLSEVLIPQPRELPSQPPAPGSFSPSETASVILRARDSVDFFVADVILRLTSPFFNRMFPLQNPEFKDGWPIIEVDEDSLVLSQLLSFIYPCVEEPDIQDYQLYTRTVLAARKYEMMSIEPKLRRRASTSMVTAEPLCMYAVASALGWDDLAKHAALNTFHQPFQDMCFVDELYLITGADLYRLMRFRFSCADAACHALKADNRFAKYGFGEWSAYYKKRIVSWNAPDSEDDTWNRRHSHDPRATEMILIDALYAFGRLQACPRGLTVGDIYQHQLSKMAEKQGGRFEMEPSTFFNIFMCMQEAPRIVEDAVSRVPLPCL